MLDSIFSVWTKHIIPPGIISFPLFMSCRKIRRICHRLFGCSSLFFLYAIILEKINIWKELQTFDNFCHIFNIIFNILSRHVPEDTFKNSRSHTLQKAGRLFLLFHIQNFKISKEIIKFKTAMAGWQIIRYIKEIQSIGIGNLQVKPILVVGIL